MQKPAGYDETIVSVGFEPLELGGHYLIILGEKQEILNGYDVLTIQFDTHSGDAQPNYYQNDYKRRKEASPDAKYQGVHRLFLPSGDPNSDSYKWANQRLKGFVQAVEESNAGFKFNWDERTLKNRMIGGVFGEEEYQGNDGNIKRSVKLRYFAEKDYIPNSKPPKLKELKESKAKPHDDTFPTEDNTGLPFDI